MTVRILLIAAVLCSLCDMASAQAKKARGPAADEDAYDFVYVGEKRPVHFRLHVRVEGKRLTAVWDEFVTHLFHHVRDRNSRNDFLNKKEVARLPPLGLLLQGGDFGGLGFGPRPKGSGTSFDALDADKDGKVTRAELDRFLRTEGAPFQFKVLAKKGASPFGNMSFPGMTPPATVEDLNREMLKHLMVDNDGKLSRKELEGAAARLAKLDVDEDEMVARTEILPSAGAGIGAMAAMAYMEQGLDPAAKAKQGGAHPVLAIDRKKPSQQLGSALIARYALKADPARLSRFDISLPPAAFDRLDKNKDGWLNAEELSHFGLQAPDLEFTCNIGGQAQSNDIALTSGQAALPAMSAKLRKAAQGGSVLEMGSEQLHLRSTGGEKLEQLTFFVRQGYTAQFGAADRDNNGYVDEAEAKNSGVFAQLFTAIDADGDGKILFRELEAFLDQVLDLQARATASTVSLTLLDEERGLFDLADLNRDGRLGVRELRLFPRVLDHYDRNKDGYLGLDEIPRNLQLTLKQGLAGAGGEVSAALALFAGRGTAQLPGELRGGPLWFRKMDKNRDGDVSRKEFFGSADDFRRIDADGDGLISLDEATRFDEQTRKHKAPPASKKAKPSATAR